MSALDFNVPPLPVGLHACAQRLSDTDHHPPGIDGSCIRGFIWAVLFEAASVLALAGLICAFRTILF